jgi:hypothetical protein
MDRERITLIAFAYAALVGALAACSTAGIHKQADGGFSAFASSIGEGALSSVCFDTKASVEQIKDALAKRKLSAEQIDAVRFAQYPGGMCVAARGSSISKELETIAELYFYAKAADVIGEAVGGVGGAIGEAIAGESAAAAAEAAAEAAAGSSAAP